MKGPARPGFEVRQADWLSFSEAQDRILSAAGVLEKERVPTGEALGRALAEDLTATATLPPWDNAAMDGYAVRGEDIAGASPSSPVSLPVVGRIGAGERSGIVVGPGQAVRIMTGAPVPAGADSVVRVEDTDAEAEAGTVRIRGDRDRNGNVRPAGEDMGVGDLVLRAGESIHPGTVGVLHALGKETVVCASRPVVAIVSTGSELRSPERYEEVRAGDGIPDSNGPMIAAAVAEAGGLPMYVGVADDDPEQIRRCLRAARDADVVITVGGASMGDADLVKRVLADLSFELDFWRVRVRPGSPVSFGHLPRDGTTAQPVFGLPGNPASSFVTFELFVRPFLRRLAGHDKTHRLVIRCRTGGRLAAPADLFYALRVRVDATTSPPTVRSAGAQGSGLVRSMSAADGLALIPEESPGAEPGQEVDVMLLGGGLNTAETRPPLAPE